MPALGALTGGLNILDKTFSQSFPRGVTAHALGRERLYTLAGKRLIGDVHRR